MERAQPAVIFYALLLSMLLFAQHAIASSFTLQQAESAALQQSPEIKALQANSQSLQQLAIAAAQFVDPKLMLGTMNVPVDSFNFSQEPMTQIQLGLMQSFPRGRSLHYQGEEKQSLSLAEVQKQQDTQLKVLRGVRLSWLQLYFWIQAQKIIYSKKKVFRHLIQVTESLLANNQTQQKDVIRAQLELSELDNRLIYIDQQIQIARSELARWIGPRLAKKAVPHRLPRWKKLPKLKQLNAIIKQHPILLADKKIIQANEAKVKYAAQQYKPGFGVGAAYGFRQGHDLDGQSRSDFLTAEVSMDLPFFTHNRQDRILNASQKQLLSSQEIQQSHHRELREQLNSHFAAWQQQRKRIWLYRSHLIPQAEHYAEATMIAYQNAQTDFSTLARAYVLELNTELAGLKAKVDRDTARINLIYLQGK